MLYTVCKPPTAEAPKSLTTPWFQDTSRLSSAPADSALLHSLGLFLLFFLAFAPSLTWLEFSGGMENVNVATALETRREGHWLIPFLNGEPRTAKPPLAQWMAALGILSSDSLPWGARWPTLVCSCLMLVATYHLGRLVVDAKVGLLAALVCGSMCLFIRYAQQAQYDPPLALLVTVANVFLATIIFNQQWWTGCVGAGIAIGLAIMTKGPIALIQSIVPAILFAAFRHWMPQTSESNARPDSQAAQAPRPSSSTKIAAILVGLALMLLICLPWTLYVEYKIPGRFAQWHDEVLMRNEARYDKPDNWWNYGSIIAWIMPWSAWLIAGLVGVFVDAPSRLRRRLFFLVCLTLVPIIIMSFVSPRRNRYLLPMITPIAILIAWRITLHVRTSRWKIADLLLLWAHWLILGSLVFGLPVAGVFFLQTVDHRPWYPWPLATLFVALAAIIFIKMIRSPRSPWTLAVGTVLLMLMFHTLFLWGYRDSAQGRSPGKALAQRLRAAYPDALAYNGYPGGHHDAPLEISIYLDKPLLRFPDPSKIPASPKPQIIIMPGPGPEAPNVPGFRLIDKSCMENDWWYALLKQP
ncbi:MAG: ArnT family glycosyltransferase [Bacillota bacterium]